MEVATNEVVAIGPHQYIPTSETPKKSYHCILCQEDEEISVSTQPMVLCTYVQSSKVLSRNRSKTIDKQLDQFDQLLMDASLYWGIHTTSCGHVMHAQCWQKYVETVRTNENRRHNRYYGFNVKKNEYLCPLCETIGNCVLPIFPDLKELTKIVKESSLNEISQQIQQEEDEPMTVKKQKLTTNLAYEDWIDGLIKTLINTVKKEQLDNRDVFIINPCPLSAITKLMTDTVARNFKSLFEFESLISGISGTTATSSSSNQLNTEVITTMESFSKTSFTVGLNQQANDSEPRMPISVWSNCAYTIRATEQLLRVDSKNLFGQFSLKQADLLASIVKQSALYGITATKHNESVRKNCVRLLATLLPYKQEAAQAAFDNEPKNVLNIDLFQFLVNLCFSMPNLYDKPNLSSVPTGGLNDFNIFKLVLQVHCFQICFIKLIKNESTPSSPSQDASESVQMLNQNETKCFEFYKYVAELIQEKKLATNLKLMSRQKLFYELKRALMPFLRCAALFFGNLTNLTPSISITSNPGKN